jgi:hypothetical protein
MGETRRQEKIFDKEPSDWSVLQNLESLAKASCIFQDCAVIVNVEY